MSKYRLFHENRSSVPHPGDPLEGLLHLVARLVGRDVERPPLGGRGAGKAELEPAAAQVVEVRGTLGDADRVVEAERCQHGRVAEPDPLRVGARRRVRCRCGE